MPKVSTPGAAPRQGGDRRVVGVEARGPASAGSSGDHRRPEARQVLQLAVAVELVAEQVHQHQHPRPQLAHDLGQRRLVDLEERRLRARAAARGPPAGRSRRPTPGSRPSCWRPAPALLARARRRPGGRSSSCRWSPRSRSRRGAARVPAPRARCGRMRSSRRPGRRGPAAPSQRSRQPARGAGDGQRGGGHPGIVAAGPAGPAGSHPPSGRPTRTSREAHREEAVVDHAGR